MWRSVIQGGLNNYFTSLTTNVRELYMYTFVNCMRRACIVLVPYLLRYWDPYKNVLIQSHWIIWLKHALCVIHFLVCCCSQNYSSIIVFFTCITKTCLFKYIENFTTKNWKFSVKNSDIFHISAQNIDCGYLLELPRRGCSNEYPQSMILNRNEKIVYTPINPRFTI